MRHFALACLLAVTIGPLACSSHSDSTDSIGFGEGEPGDPQTGGGNAASPDPGHAGGPSSTGAPGSSTGPSPGSSLPPPQDDAGPGQQPEPGVLTAGAWDDVLNPAVYASFVQSPGATSPATGGDARILVQVVGDDGAPIGETSVTVAAGGSTLVKAPTGSDGRLVLVPSRDHIATPAQVAVTVAPAPGGRSFAPVTVSPPAGDTWTVRVSNVAPARPAGLDLAFVIDTTGSMGDEISYLQSEITAIAARVATDFPGVAVRYGLVVYRDKLDTYVSRRFDFADLSGFELDLADQSAYGGGDYEESMEVGLKEMNSLSWSDGNVARVAFLVADAPPHAADMAAAVDEMNAARLRGIRLYGVAGSGAQLDAEAVLRAGSQLTGARYLFLTDDSGIGGSHETPHIPCFDVEHLDRLVGRVLASELTGRRVAPDAADIVRSVGTPVNDVCQLENAKAYLW